MNFDADAASPAAQTSASAAARSHFDVVVVGAGFAGLYMLHRARQLGLSVCVIEAGGGVGGVWYWNRYPGARCDVESMQYSYGFSEPLQQDWRWSERFASQSEILAYAQHVAVRFDLKRDIRFGRRVTAARYVESAEAGIDTSIPAGPHWVIDSEGATGGAERLTARFCIMATGCLSSARLPQWPGLESFTGKTYHTGHWPHEGVDFSGLRVGVIGTGSSGIQTIPMLAAQARELVVFQRTPNFSVPARNAPMDSAYERSWKDHYPQLRQRARDDTASGTLYEKSTRRAHETAPAERELEYTQRWQAGGVNFMHSFKDLMLDERSNATAADFVRSQIHATVDDPAVAALLAPTGYPIGAKRICVDSGYYATFNRANVTLVDVRAAPIEAVTPTGLQTTAAHYELDAIVFATGYDAMTGAILKVNITGRDGLSLAQCWSEGPKSYLGLGIAGFPNLFTITGPGSPAVLANMIFAIEQHVDWIATCLNHMRERGLTCIEAEPQAQHDWAAHVNAVADTTLYVQASSWYLSPKVGDKPRVFMPYAGGVVAYRDKCNAVVANGYEGFRLSAPLSTPLSTPIHPMLAAMLAKAAGLPAMTSVPVATIRAGDLARYRTGVAPDEVASSEDREIPGPRGPIRIRIYRPIRSAGDALHPVTVFFHGSGFVICSIETHDAMCRQICRRGACIVVSVDYALAPENKFPAAPDDCLAATRWVAEHAASFGGDASRLALAGDSAGGNLAAVTALRLRDEGGLAPGASVRAQLLLYPVTDHPSAQRPPYPSFIERATGCGLTRDGMVWFWSHYLNDAADGANPHASPVRAASLAGLPAAYVVTGDYDVLRDEGEHYASLLRAAGVAVEQVRYADMNHGFLSWVGLIDTATVAMDAACVWLRKVLAPVH